MGQEQRQLKRFHLIYYLRIFEAESGINVGHLVDITVEGIMMISEEPIPTGKDYSYKMKLPGIFHGRDEIEFKAHCLWCKKDINPEFYVSGYKIETLDPQDVETITSLISTYGFKG